MATSLALRKAAASNMLTKLLLNLTCSSPVSALSSVPPSFYTSSQMATRGTTDEDDDDYGRRVHDVRARPLPTFFPDVFDPFTTTKSLSQLMNMMKTDNPFLSGIRGMPGGNRRRWHVKEDENALHLTVDMPGLSKENVIISVEQNTLVIRQPIYPLDLGHIYIITFVVSFD